MRKKITLLTLLLSYLTILSASTISSVTTTKRHFYPVRERMLVQTLNGTWKFKLIKGLVLPSEFINWNSPNYETSEWDEITVPGNWETQGYKVPEYGNQLDEYTGLYSRKFYYDPAWNGKHVILRFDGVHFGYECYINGHYVGQWGSAFNLCQFDITPYLNTEGENLICVKVQTRSMGWEFDRNDCWSLTGISRDIELFTIDNIYLEDVRYTSEVDTNLDATIRVRVDIGCFMDDNTSCAVNISISDQQNRHVLNFNAPINKSNKTYEFKDTLKHPKLWTAETPCLYRLEVCIIDQQGNTIQRINERVGIRNVITEGTSLKVNHNPIRLRGVCLNEIDPKLGRALSYKERRQQLEMMKTANINFIRTAHYPFGPEFLELCDEMGFYVCCEVPFGHGDENLTNPDFLPELLARADATLRRDKNHPSVILWSLGNENPYTSMVEEVLKFVKHKDPTRPRGLPQAGSYFIQNRNEISENVDIYMAHYLAVDKLNEAIKGIDKPIILTEYAHSHGLSFDELENQYDNILTHPEIAGGSIWCWADQAVLTYGRNILEKQLEGHYRRATGNAQQGVWIDSLRYMDSNDYSGTDGIVYADGYPQEDYFVVRKVYSPIVISDNSLKGELGKINNFVINIENRFDFVSLHGYKLNWHIRNVRHILNKGEVWLQTSARASENIGVQAELPESVPYNDLMLCLEVLDVSEKCIYEKSLPINLIGNKKDYFSLIRSLPSNKFYKTRTLKDRIQVTTGDIQYSITNKGRLQITDKAGSILNSSLLLRVGRSITTNLEYLGRREPFYWNPYLLTPIIKQFDVLKQNDNTQVVLKCQWNRIERSEESIFGTITINIYSNGVILFDYDLKPSENATGKLLECGLTLQLDSSFDVFRWIGAGPFNYTPGKTAHAERNYWALHQNDIRFIGNKGLVDIGMVTSTTKGLVCLSNNGNIGIEDIGGQIHLSQNAIVSGYGSKFTLPKGALPVNEVIHIRGALALFVVKLMEPTPFTDGLFKPYHTVVPEQPYIKSYSW